MTELILRRCYPVPVTFADLRATFVGKHLMYSRTNWTAALKAQTGALDEVYAVVDGREVRVATMDRGNFETVADWLHRRALSDLAEHANREGYWERPHEVRLDLSQDELRTEGVE